MAKKKSRQKRIDDDASKIFNKACDSAHVELAPINGNYPSTDGLIQMVSKESEYTSKHILYQVKGKTKLKKHTYSCKVSDLRDWARSNPPVIFVLVDVDNEKTYWQKIDSAFIRRLRIPAGQKYKAIVLDPVNEVSPDSNYLEEWYSIAAGEDTLAIGRWSEITGSVDSKIDHFLGVFSLLSPLRDGDTQHIEKMREILDIEPSFFTVLLYECLKRGLIKSVGNILILNDEKEGARGLASLMENMDEAAIRGLEKASPDPKKQRVITKRLAEINDKRTGKILKENAQELLKDLRKNL